MKHKEKKIFTFGLLILIFSCSSDYTKNLGASYFYRYEANDLRDILCEKAGGGEVPADVISYNYNTDFIIALQKPRLPQDPLYEKTYTYYKGDTINYFWLIIKKERKVFGPLDEKSFNQLRKKLGVPSSLLLK